MSPRTGRPKATNPKEHRFSIRLDDEMMQKLDAYCLMYGITKARAIRNALFMLLKDFKK